MKNLNRKRLLGLMFVGCLGTMQTSVVLANAGDTIDNTATLSFSVGGVAQTDVVSNTASFVEDRVINFTVTEAGIIGATDTVPSGTAGVTFTVTNNSNDALDFSLTYLQDAGDNFDTGAVSYFLEDGTTAGYQVGEDTVAVTFLDEVAADGGTVTFHAVATMPGTVVDADLANVTVVAQAAEGGGATVQGADITNDDNGNTSPGGTANDIGDTAAMEDVFNEGAGTLDSTGAADVARNGQHSANDAFSIVTANLAVTKTSSVIYDPVNLDAFTVGNNPKAIPGAYVQYTLTIANTGSASADLTTLSDPLQAAAPTFGELDLDPNLLASNKVLGATLNFPGDEENAVADSIHVVVTGSTRAVADLYCTSVADADGCDYSGGPGGTVSVDLSTVLVVDGANGYTAGELKAGETVTITFNAIVQ